uniref:Uncharacterized protein n=1 Tax=Octopus bimaculoides TaxID=37653 RepID=A0A0L8GNP9_OCTBM
MSLRAILTTKNEKVDKLSEEIKEKLPGNMIILRNLDSVTEENHSFLYPTEFLSSLNICGPPPHIIKTETGAPVIHCNGTCYTVLNVTNTVLTLTISQLPLQPSDTVHSMKIAIPHQSCFCYVNK